MAEEEIPAPSPTPEASTSNVRYCIRCQKALHADDFTNETIKDCRTCIDYMRRWSENQRRAKRDFTLNNTEWRTHSVYVDYASCASGYVINLKTKKLIGHLWAQGYIGISVYHNGKMVHMPAHRFIYECFNGVIVDKTKVVCHQDNTKSNNAISNLRLDTSSQNQKDAYADGVKQRINTRANARSIIAIDLIDGIMQEFKSMSAASKVLKIHSGSIRSCITGATKTAHSKTTGKSYSFTLKPDQP